MKFRKILSGFIATALSLSVLPGRVLAASGSMTIDVNSVVKDTVDIGVSTDYSITNPVYVDGEVNPDFIRSFNSFKMPLVRIGEGAMSVFEWKDSIGAIENRAEQTLWNVTGKVEAGPLEIVKAYEEINPDVEFTVTLNMLTDTAEDAADFVEFLTGDVSTEWGAKRAEFGHPEPVNVSVFELGNELDRQDMSVTEYIAASKEFISAIEAVNPEAKFAAHANTGIYNAVRDNKSGYHKLCVQY